jgi:hypothetical protein
MWIVPHPGVEPGDAGLRRPGCASGARGLNPFRSPYPRLSARTFTEEYIPSRLAAVGLFRECEGP